MRSRFLCSLIVTPNQAAAVGKRQKKHPRQAVKLSQGLIRKYVLFKQGYLFQSQEVENQHSV